MLRIVHFQADRQGAGALIHCRIDEIQPGPLRIFGAVGEKDAERRRCGALLVRRSAQLALQGQQPLLANAEIHVHGVGLIERRQHGAVGGHQAAQAQLRAAHHTVDGAGDGGITQVQLSGPDQGTTGVDRGSIGVILGHDRVQFLLTHGIDFRQRLGAPQIALRLDQRRLALRQRRFRLGQRRDVGLLVDDEQQRADSHALAFNGGLLFEHATDAGSYFDGVDCLGPCDVVREDGGGLRRHGNGGDPHARRVGRALFAARHDHQGNSTHAGCPSHHLGTYYCNTLRVGHDEVLSNTHRFFAPASQCG